MANEKEQKKLLFSVTKEDCDWQTFRAGGKGGQRQNKTEIGVRCISFVLAAALFAAGDKRPAGVAMAEQNRAPEQANIRGVWKITELASRAPGSDWEIRSKPYLSQCIFTEKHYSYMYAPGGGPRKRFAGDPNRPTDAEKVEAYNSLVAASGSYVLSGSTLKLHALIHKNPNEMGGEPLTYTVELDGAALRMVIANPPFLPGREWRAVLTRIE